MAIAPIERIIPQGRFALVECPNIEAVRHLVRFAEQLEKITSRYWFEYLLLSWPGCPQALYVSAHQERHVEQLEPQESQLFVPELDLGFDEFWNSEKPLYINGFADAAVAFANKAALRAQQKTRSQFFGESVYLLNYANELDSRIERLESGEVLEEYEYRAMRWFVDDAGQYRRKQMDFSSNFGKIWFAGEWHWYSAPQQAVETGMVV